MGPRDRAEDQRPLSPAGPQLDPVAARRRPSTAQPATGEAAILRAVRRVDHVDDPERTGFYFDVLTRVDRPAAASFASRPAAPAEMLLRGLGVEQVDDSVDSALQRLWPHTAVRNELVELFTALDDRSDRDERPLETSGDVPVALHAKYTRAEALLAFGDGAIGEPSTFREGVRWLPGAQTDLFFVTLRKSERSFSPTTMYRDYALSRSLFHWESQNATHDDTPTGRRYVRHVELGTRIILFVRESETRPNGAGAAFTCLGPVTYVSHVTTGPCRSPGSSSISSPRRCWKPRSSLPQRDRVRIAERDRDIARDRRRLRARRRA